jgi:hypothetical protein
VSCGKNRLQRRKREVADPITASQQMMAARCA